MTVIAARITRVLVAPALAVMNRLNYVLKFLLIGLLLLLPFAYVTHLMIRGSNQQIVFNQKESYGVEYITAALQLLVHVESARTYATAVGLGDGALAGNLAREKQSIVELIPTIDAIDVKYSDDFKTDSGLRPCTERWKEVRAAVDRTIIRPSTPDASAMDQAGLSALVKDWVLNYAANYSNLILDPDLDSYWLMDAFVAKLPAIIADVAEATTRAVAYSAAVRRVAAGGSSLGMEERLALQSLYADASNTLDGLVNVNLKTAYSYNKSKAGTLEQAVEPLVASALAPSRAFLVLLRTQVILPANAIDDPRPIIEAADRAMRAVVALATGIGPQLNKLILARVESYRRGEARGKWAAEAATFLHVYLFIAFYIAVQTSVSKLGGFTRRMIEGTTETFKLDSHDELGKVAVLYNKINAALIESRSLRAQIERRTEELSAANQQIRRESDERARVEIELRQAQKLESVGRLASGIAHEINTPIQFVGDSVHFVRDAMVSFAAVITAYQAIKIEMNADPRWAPSAAQITATEEEADLAYLLESVPGAVARSLEGLERVAVIVRSMKEFAHPDAKEQAEQDINRAIETTLAIARSEYKYVADVETDFGEMPRVLCHLGEMNQVVLNIVVNAAHAIGDVVKGTDRRGTIRVTTRRSSNDAVITISDTGGGIPAAVRDRVFDPFFTTKEVGRGTGQGLAIARSVVVEKHGGTLTFETEMGKGTTFTIRLPIGGSAAASVAA